MPGYLANPPANYDDVLIYVNDAERSSLLPSPTVGILTYLIEEDVYEYWNGTEWLGISGGSTVAYQTTAPEEPEVGTLWIDSDATASGLNQNDFKLNSDAIIDYDAIKLFGILGI